MLPVIRDPAFYPGQFGVSGSDVERGLRWRSAGFVLYVNNIHPNTSNGNDGTNPDAPLTTIAQAFTNLATWHARYGTVGSLHGTNSYIIVSPGTYTESLTIAATTMPDYGVLMGGGNGRYPVIWDDNATDCLTITAYGWRVANFHFRPANGFAGVLLSRPSGSGAEGTVIENCFFDGQWSGTGFGVEFNGAPANCTIQNCRFAEFAATGGAITVTDTSIADPYQTHIIGCTFQECDEYITRDCAGGWNQSVIWNNVLPDATHDAAFPAGAGGTAVFIDMRGGSNGYNKVCGNWLGSDDYAEAGGYYAGTGDEWSGNYHEDTAEAEVGDNGITIDPPA